MRYQTDRPSLYPDIGDNIRMARLRQRLSQRALGNRLGVSHAAVSDIEHGKTKPDLDVLTVIADALSVPLCQIVVLERRAGSGRGTPAAEGEGGR